MIFANVRAMTCCARLLLPKGDIALALDYNRIAQQHAFRIQIQRSIAEGKLWEALYCKRLGDDVLAREAYFAALAHYEQYQVAA